MKKIRTNDDFLERFNALNKVNIKLLSKYKDSITKIKCKCLTCGYEWEAVPSVLLRPNSGCPKCAGTLKKTTEDFKNEVFIIYGEEYTVLGEYVNAKTKILI